MYSNYVFLQLWVVIPFGKNDKLIDESETILQNYLLA